MQKGVFIGHPFLLVMNVHKNFFSWLLFDIVNNAFVVYLYFRGFLPIQSIVTHHPFTGRICGAWGAICRIRAVGHGRDAKFCVCTEFASPRMVGRYYSPVRYRMAIRPRIWLFPSGFPPPGCRCLSPTRIFCWHRPRRAARGRNCSL